MYDELVKRLRNCSTEAAPCKTCDMTEDGSCSDTLMKQAADAIENMSEAYDKLSRHMDDLAALMPRWIPVTERLPEKDGTFITAYSKGGVSQNWYMTFLHGGGKWYQNSEDTGEVTHRMPLPEPPKEDKDADN